MLNVNRTFFLCFLIPCSQAIYAGSRPLPGYFITNNGDSVNCDIYYRDWYLNPETIQVEVNKEKRTLGVGDTKGFGVFGYNDYKTAVVTYHVNPINGTDLPEKLSDSTITKVVFLRVVIKGAYSLYELNLTGRNYYFLQKNDDTISELLYRVALKEGVIKEDRQYANFLAGLFLEEGILDRFKGRIYGAAYNADILSLVKILNEKHGGIKTPKTKSGHFEADVFGGCMINFFPSHITGMFPSYGDMKSSSSVSGGVSILHVTTGHFEAVKFGLSIGYDRYSGTGAKTDSTVDKADLNNWRVTTYTENLSVTSTTVMANIFAAVALNPADKIKFYLKAGLSFGFSKKDVYVLNDYKKTDTGFNSGNVISGRTRASEQVISLSNLLPNPNVGAGIETGRHKLEFSYYYPMDASADRSKVFKIGMIGIYYYFAILK